MFGFNENFLKIGAAVFNADGYDNSSCHKHFTFNDIGGGIKKKNPRYSLMLSLVFCAFSMPRSSAAPTRSLMTTISTQSDLETAVSAWCYNSTAASYEYGNISTWDISTVTSLAELFYAHCSTYSTFNEPLEAWETSSVTSLFYTFYQTFNFDQPLAAWDTSRVVNMENMLNRAHAFSQNLVAWDTGNVESFAAAFFQTDFNHDLSPWRISSATSTSFMFEYNTVFNQVLCWDTEGMTTARMFDW